MLMQETQECSHHFLALHHLEYLTCMYFTDKDERGSKSSQKPGRGRMKSQRERENHIERGGLSEVDVLTR